MSSRYLAMMVVLSFLAGCEKKPAQPAENAASPAASTTGAEAKPAVPAEKLPAITEAAKPPEPSGSERASGAADSMEGLRSELVKGKMQIDTALAALENIVKEAEGNPRPFFESFTKAFSDVEAQAATARSRADDMRARGKAYFEGWVKDLKSISSDSIREIAAGRLEGLQTSYDEITSAAAKCREAYQPFIQHLGEVKRVLTADLTAKGIGSISGQVEKARDSADDVKEAIDTLNTELTKFAERIGGGTK